MLLALWLGLAAAASQRAFAQQRVAIPPSVMEIPVQMSLAPLLRAVEQSVPRQAGNWRSWKNWHGVETKYRAWRGPLALRMRGEDLVVQAHVRYWIKARTSLLHTLDIQTDCGVDEPPRQALIGVLVRLRWTPDWSLDPRFRILPTRFLDRCEMTVADIDVTPMVGKVFRQRLRDSLRAALQTFGPRLSAIRRQAERVWSLLQEPLEIGTGSWLMLRPVRVALSPLYGRDDTARAHLALVMQPKLSVGARPAVEPRPLPPLWLFHPYADGLNFRLQADLDFSDLNGQIAASLGGKEFEIKGRKLGVDALEVSGKGQEISARMRLSGDLAGTAQVWAKVSFSPETQGLQLTDVEFTYDADDPSVGLLSDLFYEQIREQLEEVANRVLAAQVNQWQQRLSAALSRIVPQDARLDLSSLRLGSVQVRILENGIRVEGLASGTARIDIR